MALLIKHSLKLSGNDVKLWNAILRRTSEPIDLQNGLTLKISLNSEPLRAQIEYWATVLGRYRIRFSLNKLPVTLASSAYLEPGRASVLPAGIRPLVQERTVQTILRNIETEAGINIGKILEFNDGGEAEGKSESNDYIPCNLEFRRAEQTLLCVDVSVSIRACIGVAQAFGFNPLVSDELPVEEEMGIGLKIASLSLPVSDVESLGVGDVVMIGIIEQYDHEILIGGRSYKILLEKDGKSRLEITP